MKNYFVTLLFLAAFGISHAQVGINTPTPDASAALDVQSTTQGMLVPRMTETQRDLVATPATGLLVYQTDGTAGFYFYDGTAWTSLSGGGAAAGGTSEPDSLVINAFSIAYDTIYIDDNTFLDSNTPASIWGDKQHIKFVEGPGGLTGNFFIQAITAPNYDGKIISIFNETDFDIIFEVNPSYDPGPMSNWYDDRGIDDNNIDGRGIIEIYYNSTAQRWQTYAVYDW